jgi:hypothetical protein
MNLSQFELTELNTQELQETDGGFVWLIAIGACLLFSSCGNGKGNQTNTTNGIGNTTNIYNLNTHHGDTIIISNGTKRDTIVHK